MLVIIGYITIIVFFVLINRDARIWLSKNSADWFNAKPLPGADLVRPQLMYGTELFNEWVNAALEKLPLDAQEALRNVTIVVEDWPDSNLSTTYEKDGAQLLGVYIGIGLVSYRAHKSSYPRVIKIFQGPIETVCKYKKDEIQDRITQTVFHEVGHHLGMDHKRLGDVGL